MVVSSEAKPTKDLSVCEDLGGCPSAHNTPLENFKWLEKMVQAFISCVTTGNVKVFFLPHSAHQVKSKKRKNEKE